jgi:membrane metallo-endopeptidase-like protein 1
MVLVEVKKPDSSLKYVLIAFLSFAFVLSVTIIVLSVSIALDSDEDPEICSSKSCIKAANMILQNMDQTVDPCDNFYQFSCGSFENEVRIPDDQSKIDEFFMLRDKVAYSIADLLSEPITKNDSVSVANAKRLYASCVDEWSVEEKALGDLMASINKHFGGWPILKDGQYRRTRQQFLDHMIALRKVDSAQLFEIGVSYNPKNPKRFLLRVNKTIY